MMINDEAVYAAAEAVYGCGFDGSPARDAWLADFRKALEAAAPHMQYCDGSTDCASLGHIEGCFSTNPDYRRQA